MKFFKSIKLSIFPVIFLVSVFSNLNAQELGTVDTTHVPPEFQKLIPSAIYEPNVEIREVFKNLSAYSKANIYVNPNVAARISIRLTNKRLIDIIVFIVKQYDLVMSWQGDILEIKPSPFIPPPPPEPNKPSIRFGANNILSIDAKEIPTDVLIRALTEKTKRNFITETPMPEKVSGYLTDLPFSDCVKLFFKGNSVQVFERNNIFYLRRIDFSGDAQSGQQSGKPKGYWMEVNDSLVSIDVQGAPIDRLIKDAAQQLNISVFYYSDIAGSITAKASRMNYDQFLFFLLRGTNFTYKKEDKIYFLGDKSNKSLESTKLIPLKNRKVENIIEIIPPQFQNNASIKLVKEQNAILVSANQNTINDLINFIETIDYSTPQVLIEALVVDFAVTDNISTGISLGSADSNAAKGKNSYLPGVDVTVGAKTLNDFTSKLPTVDMFGSNVNLARVGKLPSDFYLRIRALENAGKAKVRSRPMLSTLNGSKAIIEVGTTQYYILKSTTPIKDQSGTIVTESQQFKTIEANIRLEITPWVSTSGEVTVEIKPLFETPVGTFSSETPPTINKRSLESTIRLSDGETVVLGGLIEESESETSEGIPYISKIPWIGTFFSNKTKSTRKSELVIYVTPRVFLGKDVQSQLPPADGN